MATLIATTDPATGTVRIDVEQTILRDLFTRVVASGWGNATTGATWTTSGGAAADYSVTGTRGQVSMNTLNVSRRTQIGANWADTDQYITLIPGVVALGASIDMGLMSRRDSVSNTEYAAMVQFGLLGVATIIIRRNLAGVGLTLTTARLPFTYNAASQVRLRMQTCGKYIRAKAWLSTVSEPQAWNVSVQDPGIPQTATTMQVGTRSILTTGNTNVSPVLVQYDDYVVAYGAPLHLYRVTPDGVETEVRGSPFYTEDPTAATTSAVATMWDNEAPFDVDIFYRLYSDCGTLLVISNTVNLASGGDGWLRSPSDPTLNLRIVMDAFFDECVEVDTIVFSGLGAREYANASGIFDIIDDRRPVTVSQIRKNYASELALTSFTLDDVDGLEDIFDAGRILMLSLPTTYGWAHRTYGSDYITCDDITQQVIGVDQQVTTRMWNIPFRLSYAPVDTDEGGIGGNGIGGGGATYDDLAASVLGTTYNSLTASGETYVQVAQGVGY